jgi:hypothetical protein
MLSVEYFAAKDNEGLIMTVPPRCGLNQADTLRVSGLSVHALKDGSVLPVDLPDINESVRAKLLALFSGGYRLPVAEFFARGLVDAYPLNIIII